MFLGGRGHFLALPWGPKLALLAFYAPLPRLITNIWNKKTSIEFSTTAAPHHLCFSCCCGVVVYIFTPIHGKTTLRLYQIVLPPPHHVFRAFMIFLAPPGYVIFLAGFHPVVTTYKEYLNNQTNTSSPPRRASFRHVFDTFMIFLTRSGPGSCDVIAKSFQNANRARWLPRRFGRNS